MENIILNFNNQIMLNEFISFFSAEIVCIIGIILNMFFFLFFKRKLNTKRLSDFITNGALILNLIISIVVLGLLLYLMPDIGLLNIALIFIISIFTSLINSYTMLIVDLKRPNLNWNSEYEVIKGSNNKSFQYGFMIIMVLILLYIGKILEGLDIKTALLIEIGIFALIFIIYDRIVKRKIDKLFDKIY